MMEGNDMKRMTGLFLAVAMMVGMLAVPATANPNATQALSVGVFNGTAVVGKVPGTCNNTTQTAPSGGGLGLPELKRNKVAHYLLSAALTAVQGVGSLTACGEIHPAFSLGKASVGAACGASSSNNGFGKVDLAGTANDKKLRGVGWITAVGGVLPVHGRTAEGAAKKKGGHVLALVLATGADKCLDKAPADPKPAAGVGSGATGFTVVGAFAMVN